MFSSRDAYENDFCPVRDELLGEMYRANENGLPRLVESVSSDVRAMLALFCYRRSHLYSLALSIAASCSERDLIQLGGRVGSTLYALSRETKATRATASSSSQPQADHALDQTAEHVLADRGSGGRRGFRGSRDRLSRACRRQPRPETGRIRILLLQAEAIAGDQATEAMPPLIESDRDTSSVRLRPRSFAR